MDDRDLAIAAAETGAAVVKRHFGAALTRIDKGAEDFATAADVEAEQAILTLLRRERPADAFVGEETGASGTANSPRRWLIDPLCGTVNYAARMRVAAVNVALMHGDHFLAAAVADPFNDEIFWTAGDAAFARAAGRDSRLSPDAGSRLVDLNVDPPFPSAPAFKATALAAHPAFAAAFRLRVVSSSIAVTWVASGQRAAYVTDGHVRTVHAAAGIAICEAAGCVVTDLAGRPWRHGGLGYIAAADSETHTPLLSLIRELA